MRAPAKILSGATLLIMVMALYLTAQPLVYPWLRQVATRQLESEIDPPSGFTRIKVESGSFADWLRHLPLKEAGAPVRLYDGRLKANQSAHVAVIDIDIGHDNLQQCADAIIRLRAEYLFSIGNLPAICFEYTNGEKIPFLRWARGERPIVQGPQVKWKMGAAKDSSYSALCRYLLNIFIYAGSYSLSRELRSRRDVSALQIGDVFIQGGFPGHAVLVVDLAENAKTGEKAFLLLQSYMPAQYIHILKNPNNESLSPWYSLPTTNTLITPEWTFQLFQLKYFE